MLKDLFSIPPWIIKERIINPFVISLSLVWIFRHKTFVLNLFSDDAYSIKVSKILEFFKCFSFWTDLLPDFGYSVLSLILFYAGSNFVFLITLFFVKWLNPQIGKLFDKNGYTKNRIVQDLRKLYGEKEDQLDKTQDRIVTLNSEVDRISKEISETKEFNDAQSQLDSAVSNNINNLVEYINGNLQIIYELPEPNRKDAYDKFVIAVRNSLKGLKSQTQSGDWSRPEELNKADFQ